MSEHRPARKDPVIEAYKKDIDVTLLRENLKLTPEERIRKLMELQRFAEELQNSRRQAVTSHSKYQQCPMKSKEISRMKVVIQMSTREGSKALPILLRHSTGMVLSGRKYIINDEAVEALRQAGVRFSELSREAE